jgi:hypothetical protein
MEFDFRAEFPFLLRLLLAGALAAMLGWSGKPRISRPDSGRISWSELPPPFSPF